MSDRNRLHGLSNDAVTNINEHIQDIRPVSEKIAAVYASRASALCFFIVSIVLAAAFPSLAIVYPLFGFIPLYLWHKKIKFNHLPMRVPIEATDNVDIDYGQREPGKSHTTPKGRIFIGYEKGTGLELWASFDDVLTHWLIYGTTGAGKTRTLISLLISYISTGTGFNYVDPKAGKDLPGYSFFCARYLGRDDDFRVINYSVSSQELGRRKGKTSNTTNFLTTMTYDAASQLMLSLIPLAEGDNKVFSDGAKAFLRASLMGLVELRDQKLIDLGVSVLREYLTLEKCIELTTDPRISEHARNNMATTLKLEVSWNDKEPPDKQSDSVRKQFAFRSGSFNEMLSSMTNTYGHIYGTQFSEVDEIDVLMQKRCKLSLLPSLSKSKSEKQSIGKQVVASSLLASGIDTADEIEGTFAKTAGRTWIKNILGTPMPIIIDEYAEINAEGVDTGLAQWRGLGLSGIIATQDRSGLLGVDKIGGERIEGNTKLKSFMAQQDAHATLEGLQALVGESDIVVSSGYSKKDLRDSGKVNFGYHDDMGTQIQKRSQVSLKDLQEQVEGESHFHFKGKLIRAEMFYVDFPDLETTKRQVRIHRLLPTPRPNHKELSIRHGALKRSYEFIANGSDEFDTLKTKLLNDITNDSFVSELEQIKIDGHDKAIAKLLSLSDSLLSNNSLPANSTPAIVTPPAPDSSPVTKTTVISSASSPEDPFGAPQARTTKFSLKNSQALTEAKESTSFEGKPENYPPQPTPEGTGEDDVLNLLDELLGEGNEE